MTDTSTLTETTFSEDLENVPEELKALIPEVQTVSDDAFLRFLSGEELHVLEGLSVEDLEALYTVGKNLYEAQAFVEASQIFQQLCLLKDSDYRFWFSLGASLQQIGHQEEALESFAICQSIEPDNPLPAFHAYECHLSLGDVPRAILALKLVSALARDTDEEVQLARRAANLIQELESSLAGDTSPVTES